MHVSEMGSWIYIACMECSNLSRWDFPWPTQKSWAVSDFLVAISAALHESFAHSKYIYRVYQFLLYWRQIVCCIYKEFVQQLIMKAF